MKRSSSLSVYRAPILIKKSFTQNEIHLTERDFQLTSAQLQFQTTDKHSKVISDYFNSPISLISSFNKVSTKILTSDFWPNSMKLRLRRISETRLPSMFTEVKMSSKPVEEGSEILGKYKKSSTKINGVRKRIHLGKISKVKQIDRIISECNLEMLENKKFGKELVRSQKRINSQLNLARKLYNS